MERVSASSHIGMRENIEDACGAVEMKVRGSAGSHDLAMFVVPDGVGGEQRGEECSAIAVDTCTIDLPRLVIDELRSQSPDIERAIDRAVDLANNRILERAEATGCPRMATTLVLAVVIDGWVYLAWLGDSRAYVFRDGQLHPLTRDHSVVQQMVDAGQITPDQAEFHPKRHAITQCLGRPEATAEYAVYPLTEGDILLLCSDGLLESLSEQQVGGMLQLTNDEPSRFDGIAERLTRSAVDRGATDNVTALCAVITQGMKPHPPTGQATVTTDYPEQLADAVAA
jgi:protein phosphatase